jgi:hypothetical protein
VALNLLLLRRYLMLQHLTTTMTTMARLLLSETPPILSGKMHLSIPRGWWNRIWTLLMMWISGYNGIHCRLPPPYVPFFSLHFLLLLCVFNVHERGVQLLLMAAFFFMAMRISKYFHHLSASIPFFFSFLHMEGGFGVGYITSLVGILCKYFIITSAYIHLTTISNMYLRKVKFPSTHLAPAPTIPH